METIQIKNKASAKNKEKAFLGAGQVFNMTEIICMEAQVL